MKARHTWQKRTLDSPKQDTVVTVVSQGFVVHPWFACEYLGHRANLPTCSKHICHMTSRTQCRGSALGTHTPWSVPLLGGLVGSFGKGTGVRLPNHQWTLALGKTTHSPALSFIPAHRSHRNPTAKGSPQQRLTRAAFEGTTPYWEALGQHVKGLPPFVLGRVSTQVRPDPSNAVGATPS